MKGLTYLDPATIVRLHTDEYGDASIIQDREEILCLFRYGMTSNQNDYVNNLGTDAHVYLDIENPFIQRNMHRVEGMYLVINRYGEDEWYRIEKSVIGRTLLTDNTDNNLHCWLSKSATLVDLS